MTITAQYAEFAAREARGVSPVYECLSLAISRDDEVLDLLGTLPPAKRQPNLLFGVVRFLGGPVEDTAAFHDYVTANWLAIEAEMCVRATQTNEAGRCAVLLPVLATLPQPLALLEVGASAGLCLYPTGTPTATATTWSAPANRSLTAPRPAWRRPQAYPRWCGGPVWT